MRKVWFITGCSTGFGRSLAERLIAMGEAVVATAQKVKDLKDLEAENEDRLLTLQADVTNSKQVRKAVEAAIKQFDRIDVLVNNAGYGYFATQEESDIEEVRNVFDTNVLGFVRTVEHVVPHMRSQGGGCVVNLSSIAGRISFPRSGFYSATKFAIESLSESLYYEVAPFGIRVLVIEPGAYATEFAKSSAVRSEELSDPESPYFHLQNLWNKAAAETMPRRQNPAEVVDGIISLVNSGTPFARVAFGEDAKTHIKRREEMGEHDFVEAQAKLYIPEGSPGASMQQPDATDPTAAATPAPPPAWPAPPTDEPVPASDTGWQSEQRPGAATRVPPQAVPNPSQEHLAEASPGTAPAIQHPVTPTPQQSADEPPSSRAAPEDDASPGTKPPPPSDQ